MRTAVITVKTEPKIKQQAQRVAAELGLSVSDVVNGYLREFVRERAVHFNLSEEKPTKYLLDALRESEEDRRRGDVSPAFDNAKDAIAWLRNPRRKYVNSL